MFFISERDTILAGFHVAKHKGKPIGSTVHHLCYSSPTLQCGDLEICSLPLKRQRKSTLGVISLSHVLRVPPGMSFLLRK